LPRWTRAPRAAAGARSPLRHQRARQREEAFVGELRAPSGEGQALAALADYAAALRLAEHRLATRS
jgi:hypothetical protein